MGAFIMAPFFFKIILWIKLVCLWLASLLWNVLFHYRFVYQNSKMNPCVTRSSTAAQLTHWNLFSESIYADLNFVLPLKSSLLTTIFCSYGAQYIYTSELNINRPQLTSPFFLKFLSIPFFIKTWSWQILEVGSFLKLLTSCWCKNFEFL